LMCKMVDREDLDKPKPTEQMSTPGGSRD
jgi:hypothetical protein